MQVGMPSAIKGHLPLGARCKSQLFSSNKYNLYKEYERQSIWSQSKSNSRVSGQALYMLCLVKSCHKLSYFLVKHSKLKLGGAF